MENKNKENDMSTNLAYDVYNQNNIGVESPVKLIEMMYQGVLRFNVQIKKAIQDKDIEKKTYWVNRAIAVIAELINSLDYNHGDIAHYLEGLYNHQIKLLLEVNINEDLEKLDTVNRVFKGLLEAWREETQNVAK